MNNSIKIGRARRINSFLPTQERDVWALIPESLVQRLTVRDLSEVAAAINRSYHNGRASTGADVVDSGERCGAVYVNGLERIIDWEITDEGPRAWIE